VQLGGSDHFWGKVPPKWPVCNTGELMQFPHIYHQSATLETLKMAGDEKAEKENSAFKFEELMARIALMVPCAGHQ